MKIKMLRESILLGISNKKIIDYVLINIPQSRSNLIKNLNSKKNNHSVPTCVTHFIIVLCTVYINNYMIRTI